MTARRLLRLWARDRRGVSAVEFALLAPVMIALYFGLAELCQGFMAQRRVSHVASAVADMVARADALKSTEVDDILAIGELVMRPFSTKPLRRRVASVVLDDKGTAKVAWLRGDAIADRPLARGDAVTLPEGLVSKAGESVIMADTAYDYESPLRYLMPSAVRFTQTYYLRPRTVEQVALTD